MVLTLEQIRGESARFGRLAFIATASPSGTPYASPVAVAWHGDVLLAFLASNEAKVANVRSNPKVSVHFAVSAETDWDSCVLWGTGRIIDDAGGRRALWDKMGYDCNVFEPGGPEANTHVFLEIAPYKALILRNYGIKGRDSWHR